MGLVVASACVVVGVVATMLRTSPRRPVPALSSPEKLSKARKNIGIDEKKINIAISGNSGVGRL